MRLLWLLWKEFFQTGLFSIGGGLATLPFLQSIARRYDWFSIADLADMIAVSESTPGPIGVNMATYAGFRAMEVPGAILATVSLVLPSVIIIIFVSRALTRFRDNRLVKHGFYGLRPATAGLIAGAAFSIYRISLLNEEAYATLGAQGLFRRGAIALFLLFFLLIRKFPKVHPILFILAGAVIGIVCRL